MYNELSMTLEVKLAKIIKNARLKANLTQVEVAKLAGIHHNYYARIERAEVMLSAETLNSIVKALNINLELPLK